MSKSKKAAEVEQEAKVAQPAKQNASQKIESLENAFMAQNQQIQILADEIDGLRNVITSLSKRINASIQAAEEGALSGDSVNKIILNENIKELEGKISFLVEQDVLERNDDAEISDETFVVGRQIDTEGNIVNPRIQFAVKTVESEVRNRMLGKKAGAVISYDETSPSLEIVEVYTINQNPKPKNFEQTSQQ